MKFSMSLRFLRSVDAHMPRKLRPRLELGTKALHSATSVTVYGPLRHPAKKLCG